MQCDWAIFDPLGYIKAYAVLCACISDLSGPLSYVCCADNFR